MANPIITVLDYQEIRVSAGSVVRGRIRYPHLTNMLVMSAAGNGVRCSDRPVVFARLGGEPYPIELRTGEDVTFSASRSSGNLTLMMDGSFELTATEDVWVRIFVSRISEPSAIDQLADLAR